MKNRITLIRIASLFIVLLIAVSNLGGCLQSNDSGRTETAAYISVEQLSGKKIGYIAGSVYIDQINELLPESTPIEYQTYAEIIQALKTGRIDAYVTDEPMARCQIRETTGLTAIENMLSEDTYGFFLNKADAELGDQMSDVIRRFESRGVFDKLKDKWINGEGDPNLTFNPDAETPKGELKIAVAEDSMPFAYIAENKIVGYDVELLYLICEELGYKPILTSYPFDTILNTIASGREDIAIGCITYTDERAEVVHFTDTTYYSGTIAVVSDGTEEKVGFIDGIKASLVKNLIVEDRWKMILKGLWVTIELSVLSLVTGTLLGFVFSFMLRSKNRLISGVSNLVSVILDGLPLLIVLMVFYYIIFAKTSLSAITIGVLGLALDFANGVAGTLNTGIKAVDKGQIEAAEAMGYSKLMVFKKIIFPQAANQMFGSYSGSIISLVKGTSIIGYITVEDLTKVTDNIRSRTFEAFFPLVFTAILYFIIARIFVALLSRFAKRLDPKCRKREIKGVQYND